MKPIERLHVYLKFRTISPHSFEKRIGLSNGYFSKQLRNLGSIGSDILIKIDNQYAELNILWVLTGQGEMLSPSLDTNNTIPLMQVDEYLNKYEVENKKMKVLESDLEKLNVVLKDKDKIISLYEVIANNKPLINSEKIEDSTGSFG
ncbi:MAG: hypothetical protein NT104_03215 [Bacteroidetes bacterium]|nr:hypothetical protein [Bacteroidota bacterium]